MLHSTKMYGASVMNCDTGEVFCLFPLKLFSICMFNVTVTFLSRLHFFPRKLKCFCALFIAGIFLQLKKNFHQWGPFRTPTEDIKNIL